MKPKGVTTQMKALDEYFLMVVFTLLLNRVHVFASFMFSEQLLRNLILNFKDKGYKLEYCKIKLARHKNL